MSNARTTRANGKINRNSQVNRRQEIIDAAAVIFREKGYEVASIQDVADTVNILKGSLYYYIKSKNDLLFEIIQEVHQGGLENLAREKELDGNALERIRSFVVRHMIYNARNLVKMTVFFHDFRSLDPDRRSVIVEERDSYDRYLRELIASGQQEGSVRSNVDPKMATFSILGSTNWMYQWYRPDGPKPIEEIAAEFAELVVESLQDPSWSGPS